MYERPRRVGVRVEDQRQNNGDGTGSREMSIKTEKTLPRVLRRKTKS